MPRNQNPSLAMSDPLRIAWQSLCENKELVPEDNPHGACGRCQRTSALISFKHILSNNFTGWGTVDPSAEGLCDSCAWGYREERLRYLPVIVYSRGHALFASNQEVKNLLLNSLPPDVVATVPFLGKKHLLPHAEWGKVVGDDGNLSWRSPEAELVGIIEKLREFNIYESELAEPAPPSRVVMLLYADANKMIALMDLWDRLRSWQHSPHLKISLRATRLNYVINDSFPLNSDTVMGKLQSESEDK